MDVSPKLDDNHTTCNDHHEILVAMNTSASTTPPARQLLHDKLAQKPVQIDAGVELSESAAKTSENPLDGDRTSEMIQIHNAGQTISSNNNNTNNINNNNNNHESSIKLKRCKHGRIKIRDLSKKKLGQRGSDNSANSAPLTKDESNNNNSLGTTNSHTPDDMEGMRGGHSEPIPAMDAQANRLEATIARPTISSTIEHNDQPRTPPPAAVKMNNHKPSNKLPKDTKSERISGTRHTDNRGRSRSRSKTPSRTDHMRVSPFSKSRYSRSPSPRDRSSSRDRTRTSRRRRHSPSPKRSTRTRSRKRKHSFSSRRYRHSPERSKYPESYRHHRRSPRSRSPNRRSPKSRSRSPSHNGSNHRRRCRDASRSPSRDDRYPSEPNYSMKNDISVELSQRISPKTRESQGPALITSKVNHVTGSQDLLSGQSDKPDVAPLIIPRPAINSTNQPGLPRTLQQTSGPNFLPRLAQADPDPRENSACSPTTPSNGDSAASDIYDPEGPVLPISPVDSPPIVEKGDEEDVPSSAVQLNQQEKYLQKFHRQERVVEEVKIALKPFYQKRTINKEQYKDILRKAVPRICHSKNGEINPVKIRSMVDAYVKKMR